LAAYDIFSPTTGAVKLTLPAVADMAFVRGTAQAYERTLAFLAFRQAKVEMGLTRSLGIAKGLDRVTISQGVPRSFFCGLNRGERKDGVWSSGVAVEPK
jgi:hypothetical protein